MIKLIGIKRIIILSALTGMAMFVAVVYFASIQPARTDAEVRLNAITGQISELRSTISNLKQELASLKENMPKYQALKDKGFFADQDRFVISHNIEDLKNKLTLNAVPFSVGDIVEVPDAEVSGIKYKLIDSRITVGKITATIDNDIYAFLQGIAASFPVQARIQSFDIKRDLEVDKQHLQDLSSGKPVSFVSADITFDWLTMLPKEQPGGASPAATGGAR